MIASKSHVELGSFADIEIDADATEHGRLPLDERKIDGLDVDLVLVVEAVIDAGLNERTYHGPAIVPAREKPGGHHSREFFELPAGKANPAEADMVVGPRRQVIESGPKIDPRARPCGDDRACIDRRDETGRIEISMTTVKAGDEVDLVNPSELESLRALVELHWPHLLHKTPKHTRH